MDYSKPALDLPPGRGEAGPGHVEPARGELRGLATRPGPPGRGAVSLRQVWIRMSSALPAAFRRSRSSPIAIDEPLDVDHALAERRRPGDRAHPRARRSPAGRGRRSADPPPPFRASSSLQARENRNGKRPLASSNARLALSVFVRWYSRIRPLMRATCFLSFSSMTSRGRGRQLRDPALDGLVVLVGAEVREVVVPAVDDPGVGLTVIGIHDDVDPADLGFGDPVDDRAEVLDLDVVEGPGRRRVILVDAADPATLPIQVVWR